MGNEIENTAGDHLSPFERIKRTNDAGTEFWSSREFAGVLGYGDYRNFEGVVEKAKMACFNSGHRIEDHFGDVTDMVAIGSGAERPVKTVLLSRYACYLVIQNADPKKEIVAHGQTYFATQTRRQDAGRIAGGGKHQEDRGQAAQATWQGRAIGERHLFRSQFSGGFLTFAPPLGAPRARARAGSRRAGTVAPFGAFRIGQNRPV
jgi:DNA-damage-inducible protein D